MEISWTDRVRNKEVLQTVNEDRNILQTIKLGKSNLIGHILRKNCLLKHVSKGIIEGRLEVAERQEKRRKQLLVERMENTGYWKFKEESLGAEFAFEEVMDLS
jgi:hypothetical protein